MPELPECETVVRRLASHLTGRMITTFVPEPSFRTNANNNALMGKVINTVSRYGKYIVISFAGGKSGVIIHLRMTGNLLISKEYPSTDDSKVRWFMSLISKQQNLQFVSYLIFHDVRKFGTLDYYEDLSSAPLWYKLGVDGLLLSRPYCQTTIAKKAEKTSRPIKNFILDQSIIAGNGNLYSSEVLWHLNIDPEMPTNECVHMIPDICNSLKSIFEEAINHGGSSISDFIGGSYQQHHKVYGRLGQPCYRCSTKIEKLVQAGRSTFYCPRCQKNNSEEST